MRKAASLKLIIPIMAGKGSEIYLGLFGLVLLALAIGPLLNLTFAWEMETLNIRQKWSAPAYRGDQIPLSLVSIDSKTMGDPVLHTLFQSGFSRSAAGYAVRFFNRTHPQMVFFDASFNGGIHQDDRASDRSFANSIQPKPRVASSLIFENEAHPVPLLPSTLSEIQKNTLIVHGLEHFPQLDKGFKYNNIVPPYPELLISPMQFFASNNSIASASLDKGLDDTSGYSRRWSPLIQYEGKFYPTIALGALLQGAKEVTISPLGKLSWAGGAINLGSDGIPLIKWHGHGVDATKPVYPEYSFSDVVLSEITLECQEDSKPSICRQPDLPAKPLLQPELFKNRYVLTGFTYTNSPDEHPTIYKNKYPGVYIAANILDNALKNDFIQPSPMWLNVLLTLMFPLILAYLILRFQSITFSVVGLVSLCMIHFMICLEAYQRWNFWVYCIYPILALLICFTSVYVYRYAKEYKHRQQIRHAFGKYVSPAVLQTLEKHPEQVKLGCKPREMTFLFSDIRGFTSFSERNEPTIVISLLSKYFTTMNSIIMNDYKGSINKLMGDAIMAYWGFPLENEDHPYLAVAAALTMQEAMTAWRAVEGNEPLHIRIGIHTGEAMIGNVGSEDFMDFTVIGDAVNIASRLESAGKEHSCKIIISAATYEKVRDRIAARPLGMATLAGKLEQVEIYEPTGFL